MDDTSTNDEQDTAMTRQTKHCNGYINWLQNQETLIIGFIQSLYQQQLNYIDKIEKTFQIRLQRQFDEQKKRQQDQREPSCTTRIDSIIKMMLGDSKQQPINQNTNIYTAGAENNLSYNCIMNKNQDYQSENNYHNYQNNKSSIIAHNARISETQNILATIAKIRIDISTDSQKQIIRIVDMYQNYKKSIMIIFSQSNKWIDFQQAKKLLALKRLEVIDIFQSNSKRQTSINQNQAQEHVKVKTEQSERATGHKNGNFPILPVGCMTPFPSNKKSSIHDTKSDQFGTVSKSPHSSFLCADRIKVKMQNRTPLVEQQSQYQTEIRARQTQIKKEIELRTVSETNKRNSATLSMNTRYEHEQCIQPVKKHRNYSNGDLQLGHNYDNVNIVGLSWYNEDSDENDSSWMGKQLFCDDMNSNVYDNNNSNNNNNNNYKDTVCTFGFVSNNSGSNVSDWLQTVNHSPCAMGTTRNTTNLQQQCHPKNLSKSTNINIVHLGYQSSQQKNDQSKQNDWTFPSNHNNDNINQRTVSNSRKPNNFMSIYKQLLFTNDLSRKWQCIKCNRIITTRSGLVSHYNKHIGIKKFTCQYCNRKFANGTSLLRHERVHTGARPFKCHICYKTFIQKYQRNLHIQVVHDKIKKYSCNICQKQYTQSGSLRRHQKTSHQM